MEFNLELLWLLFVGAYFLLGGRRRKAAKQRQQEAARAQASGDVPAAPRAATPFQDFMNQMEEAMREASGEAPASSEIEKPLSAPDTMVPEPVPVTTVPAARVEEFHSVGSFKSEGGFESAKRTPHQEHGYGLDNPFSEEAFEGLARGRDITSHAKGHLDYDPHGLKRSTPVVPRTTTARLWRKRLQDPKQAQDALVLSEIFNGPWTPRRRGQK